MFYIGCHLSSAKGFLAMGKDAEKIGATTFQFFTRNPRGGSAKPLDHEDIAAFLKLKEELGLGTLDAAEGTGAFILPRFLSESGLYP